MENNAKKNTTLYIIAVVLIIVGAVFMVASLKEKSDFDKKGFEDFNEISYKDLKDGTYVEGEFIEAYSPFAETYSTKYGIRLSDDSDELCYVVPSGSEEEYETLEYRYIGFLCSSSWYDKMDDLIDQTEDYYEDDYAAEPVPVAFTAKVRDMTDEEIGWMEEYFIESGIDEDDMDYYTHPVVLEVFSKDGYKGGLYIGLGMAAIGVVVFVVAIVLKSKNKKQEDVYY